MDWRERLETLARERGTDLGALKEKTGRSPEQLQAMLRGDAPAIKDVMLVLLDAISTQKHFAEDKAWRPEAITAINQLPPDRSGSAPKPQFAKPPTVAKSQRPAPELPRRASHDMITRRLQRDLSYHENYMTLRALFDNADAATAAFDALGISEKGLGKGERPRQGVNTYNFINHLYAHHARPGVSRELWDNAFHAVFAYGEMDVATEKESLEQVLGRIFPGAQERLGALQYSYVQHRDAFIGLYADPRNAEALLSALNLPMKLTATKTMDMYSGEKQRLLDNTQTFLREGVSEEAFHEAYGALVASAKQYITLARQSGVQRG